MHIIRFSRKGACVLVIAVWMSLALLPACSVNVKKQANGEDKQVDIKTPMGGIHVSKQADASDTGLAVYPGARLKAKGSEGDDKSANVNISGFGFALKIIALQYESDATPEQLVSFYRDQLKKYGNVLECHSANHLNLDTNMSDNSKSGSHELTCGGSRGNHIELKVGTRENQHIVAVEPEGKGSGFSLVYVRTHGKDADI